MMNSEPGGWPVPGGGGRKAEVGKNRKGRSICGIVKGSKKWKNILTLGIVDLKGEMLRKEEGGGGENVEDYGGDGGARDDCLDSTSQKSSLRFLNEKGEMLRKVEGGGGENVEDCGDHGEDGDDCQSTSSMINSSWSLNEERILRFEKEKLKLERVQKYIMKKTYPKEFSEVEKRTLRKQAKRFYVDADDVLHFKDKSLKRKVIFTLSEAKAVLWLYHSNSMVGGHSGLNSTRTKISTFYYWKGITTDVTEYVKSCVKCQFSLPLKTQAPVMTPIRVSMPLELVGIDLIGPLAETTQGNKYVLSMTDYFTKWVWFVGLKSKSADKVARGVLEYVRMFGPPKRILSDQGREFCNQTNEHLFSKFKIRHSMKSAYHPQTNGLDERTNQTLKIRIAKLIHLESGKNKDWDLFLGDIAFSMNTQKQATTKYSPYFLMFGRNPYQLEEVLPTVRLTTLWNWKTTVRLQILNIPMNT